MRSQPGNVRAVYTRFYVSGDSGCDVSETNVRRLDSDLTGLARDPEAERARCWLRVWRCSHAHQVHVPRKKEFLILVLGCFPNFDWASSKTGRICWNQKSVRIGSSKNGWLFRAPQPLPRWSRLGRFWKRDGWVRFCTVERTQWGQMPAKFLRFSTNQSQMSRQAEKCQDNGIGNVYRLSVRLYALPGKLWNRSDTEKK